MTPWSLEVRWDCGGGGGVGICSWRQGWGGVMGYGTLEGGHGVGIKSGVSKNK